MPESARKTTKKKAAKKKGNPRTNSGRKRTNNTRTRTSQQVEIELPTADEQLNDLPANVRQTLSALTIPQRRYVMAYCGQARGNGVLAVQIAGIGSDSSSYIARATVSSNLLREPRIRAAIEAWMNAYALGASEVTWRIKDMADITPAPFFEVSKEGVLQLRKVMSSEDWEAHAHWVKAVTMDKDTGQVMHLELHDRHRSLDLLAKILKLHSDQPIVAFNTVLRSMSDDALLAEITRAREEELTGGAAAQMPALLSGAPIAVVPSPTPEQA